MDEEDEEPSQFMTPLLTPYTSETSTTAYEQNMNNVVRNLEENLNHHYPSENNDYESENESDAQDQQPTEATDDSILPNQIPIDPVETTIDIAFQPQPSHDRDDICSPEQDIESSDQVFSSAIADVDIIYETKAFKPSNLDYGESGCVPYTDEIDEISIIKQTLTTTTLTTEYIEPKKDKHNIGHIMISYNHSTKLICSRIAQALKDLNYFVWIDQDNMSGDILTCMASAVENSFVVLMAVNEQYYQSRYCRLEAEYSMERNKASIPMLMQAGYKATGWLGIINGAKLHIDFSKLQFDEAFNSLRREIEVIRRSLGADEIERSSVTTSIQSMTTMSSSWNHYQDVHEWNTDDVIEWLNREKLQIFENVLTGFTGATLWQLYKIKFDSPPDYYRTIESFPLPTTPLRLFYNLTFHAALEALFSSSSNQKSYR